LADLLAGAFDPAAVPPPGTAAAPPAAPATSPAPAPPVESDPDAALKLRRLYATLARVATRAVDGLTDRLVRSAGREPAEMDDDEEAMIREGFEEQFRIWFGRTELTPLGKVAVGAGVATAGKYFGGKPIEKPTPLPTKLADKPTAAAGAAPTPTTTKATDAAA
jgi:hypothetical protein